MTGTEVTYLSCAELVESYRRRELSPVEVVAATLARISACDGTVNAFCLVDADHALEQARASAQRWVRGEPTGRLDGVPVAIKDLLAVRGWVTRRGSYATSPTGVETEDASSVAALRRHGAVLVGKTTTPEIGWKGVTDSPLTGVTRNPWRTDCTAGGSSGGSAAAVALGMVPLATGTDGGGSLRIPAGFCGVVGFKPTSGLVPMWPRSSHGGLSHHGPFARSVRDAALMLDVMGEPDVRDQAAAPPPAARFARTLDDPRLDGLRVAFSPTLGGHAVQPEVKTAVADVARTLETLGARVDEAEPDFGEALELHDLLWNVGLAHATSRWSQPQRAWMDPGLRRATDDGARHAAVDYVEADLRRADLARRAGTFLQTYDLLLTPTLPLVAFAAGRDVPEHWPDHRWQTWTPFTYPFNLTHQPALSVPCGFSDDGLPVGAQLVGRRYDDALVLRAGNSYQQAAPCHDHPPDGSVAAVGGA